MASHGVKKLLSRGRRGLRPSEGLPDTTAPAAYLNCVDCGRELKGRSMKWPRCAGCRVKLIEVEEPVERFNFRALVEGIERGCRGEIS